LIHQNTGGQEGKQIISLADRQNAVYIMLKMADRVLQGKQIDQPGKSEPSLKRFPDMSDDIPVVSDVAGFFVIR